MMGLKAIQASRPEGGKKYSSQPGRGPTARYGLPSDRNTADPIQVGKACCCDLGRWALLM